VKGTPPPGCNGAVFRANPDGSDLETFATGFRNVYVMGFSPDGRLFGIDQGYDNGGSRPVANDFDSLWVIQKGGWYGFPDFPSGIPITL
jgi:glucose/arabinose dehydrogenase